MNRAGTEARPESQGRPSRTQGVCNIFFMEINVNYAVEINSMMNHFKPHLKLVPKDPYAGFKEIGIEYDSKTGINYGRYLKVQADPRREYGGTGQRRTWVETNATVFVVSGHCGEGRVLPLEKYPSHFQDAVESFLEEYFERIVEKDERMARDEL